MKKLLAFVLVLSILTLAGCSKTSDSLSDTPSDVSSQFEINTSEIISSSEDISSDETSSEDITSSQVDESTTTSSIESTPSSKVEETTPPTSSESGTESKNETPTTPTQPTTFFEKHDLKLTPISNELCLNDDPNHTCPYDKEISLPIYDLGENDKYLFAEEIFGNSFDPSNYKVVGYFISAEYTYDLFSCGMTSTVIFDKYTGTILLYSKARNNQGWQELTYNNKKIYTRYNAGGGAGGRGEGIYCPLNYDGVIFAVVKDLEIPDADIDAGKITKADEIIDFENDTYYLFAAN